MYVAGYCTSRVTVGCGHCKKLTPELENAARRLKARPDPIYIGKVDATVEKDLAKEYGVSGYPTMKLIRRGKRFDYNGPRQADGIVTCVRWKGSILPTVTITPLPRPNRMSRCQ